MKHPVHPAIAFTLETPNSDGRLPFLDCEVSHSEDGYRSRLYIKSFHSGSFFPFFSRVPHSLKIGVVLGEIRRALSRSTTRADSHYSLQSIVNRLLLNGYPPLILKKCIMSFYSPKVRRSRNNVSYIRVPFISESHTRILRNILRQSDLQQHVCFYFISPKPLHRQLGPLRDKPTCKPNCKICTLCMKPYCCLQKNVIYKVECTLCNKVYIGETGRQLKSRIKEHFTQAKSAIHSHHCLFHATCDIYTHYHVSILLKNISNLKQRLYAESILINKHKNNLMNGCVGLTSSIQLNIDF